jgi:hypothetical protein
MENIEPLKYKSEIVGYYDNDQKLTIQNKELWDKIIDNNPQHIFISSKGKGTIKSDGKVFKQETISYDIESLTANDYFSKEKEKRQWNRYFEKNSEVMLDEEWMDDYEKKQFFSLIGKTKFNYTDLDGMDVLANVRYRGKTALAKLTCLGDDTLRVDFYHEVKTITAGQSTVFYDPNNSSDVIGGGHIYEVL